MCGLPLPAGLREADQLPAPIFTPSTKAAVGIHDENISFDDVVARIGGPVARGRPRPRPRRLRAGRGARRGTGHHPGRHQAGARAARRPAGPGRRGPHAGLVALLARRRLAARAPRPELRQAAGARRARPPAAGTSGRRRPPLSAATVAATRARYIEGYERLSGRSFDEWPGGTGRMIAAAAAARATMAAVRSPCSSRSASARHRRSAGCDHRALVPTLGFGTVARRHRRQGHPLHGRGRRRGAARRQVEELCQRFLTNPVIEERDHRRAARRRWLTVG